MWNKMRKYGKFFGHEWVALTSSRKVLKPIDDFPLIVQGGGVQNENSRLDLKLAERYLLEPLPLGVQNENSRLDLKLLHSIGAKR